MIRDRFAMAVLGVTVGFFTTLAAVANLEDVPRNIDIVALWLAGLLQLGLLLTWVFIPRLPRWIVAGWGRHRRDHHGARARRRVSGSVGTRWARDRRDRDHDPVRGSLARIVNARRLKSDRRCAPRLAILRATRGGGSP